MFKYSKQRCLPGSAFIVIMTALYLADFHEWHILENKSLPRILRAHIWELWILTISIFSFLIFSSKLFIPVSLPVSCARASLASARREDDSSRIHLSKPSGVFRPIFASMSLRSGMLSLTVPSSIAMSVFTPIRSAGQRLRPSGSSEIVPYQAARVTSYRLVWHPMRLLLSWTAPGKENCLTVSTQQCELIPAVWYREKSSICGLF